MLTVAAIGLAAPAGAQQGPPENVEICHNTSSDTNPIVLITVAVSALPAHFAHGDTFPVGGVCPGAPDRAPARVTVCHVLGNGGYNELTIDDSALPAHVAHGDIYPVPANGCPGTPTLPPPPPQIDLGRPVVVPPVTPAANPTVVAAAASQPQVAAVSQPQELARTGVSAVGVQVLLAAALMAIGALCLRRGKGIESPTAWSCPDLPEGYPPATAPSRPKLAPINRHRASWLDGLANPWDVGLIPSLIPSGGGPRGAPPPPPAGSWLSRAGP